MAKPPSDADVPQHDSHASLAPVSSDRLREVLGAVCTPIGVVTAQHRMRPHGTTVNSFCSLSLEPPLVLVGLHSRSDVLRMIRVTRAFGLNVLAHDQGELARVFARGGSDVFRGVPWSEDHGVPRLDGCLGWLACRVHHLSRGGDHTVVAGLVVHADYAPIAPLVTRLGSLGNISGTFYSAHGHGL